MWRTPRGVWAAFASACASAAFHAGLLAAPLTLGALAAELGDVRRYDFSPTPRTLALTQQALDESLQAAAQPAHVGLREAVHAALMQDRLDIARGLLLSAAADVPGADAEKLAEAVRLLSFNDRALFTERLGGQLLPAAAFGPAAAVEAVRPRGQDEGALALQSALWLIGQPIDETAWRLQGLLLSPNLTTAQQSDVHDAAQLIKHARRSGHLPPSLEAHLRGALEAALPEQALAAHLTPAVRTAQRNATTRAFAAAQETHAVDALLADLSALAAVQRAAPQGSAFALVEHMHAPEQLARWGLLAQAGGDRLAALVALEGPEAALRAARGALHVSNYMRELIALLLGALATMMAATFAAAYAEGHRLPPQHGAHAV